ncbi:Myb-like domain containing protein [Parasponia andersonii]|uniref:Myb-like domain containing protein n=1 Tax=Parasponia andersonii TaxID=3476 RepID=A0A2P5DT43_PARAD|nr:Myb-like domain containing protein [Parasponia andersonii]
MAHERSSGSRRTRSQVAPDWSAMDALILVNEIAAVEADCLKALSSFQKWMIITENCAAQDVNRNVNQCRRKWDSLLLDYNRIKQWESKSKSRASSYWSLKTDRRESLGLPRDFDDELFLAIENLVNARENQADTDPDSDAEANYDKVDLVGSKRQRRQLISEETCEWKSVAEAKPMKDQAERKPPKSLVEKNPVVHSIRETSVRSPPQEKLPQRSSKKNEPQKGHVEEFETIGNEEKEQMIAFILHENAEMVKSIVSKNAEYEATKAENGENCQTKSAEFVRRQGHKLIACLGEIVKSLDQVRDFVH